MPTITTGTRSNISPKVTQIFLVSSDHPNMQEMSSLKTKVSVHAIRKKRKSWFTDTSRDQVSNKTKPAKITSNLATWKFHRAPLATTSPMKMNSLHIHIKKRA